MNAYIYILEWFIEENGKWEWISIEVDRKTVTLDRIIEADRIGSRSEASTRIETELKIVNKLIDTTKIKLESTENSRTVLVRSGSTIVENLIFTIKEEINFKFIRQKRY